MANLTGQFKSALPVDHILLTYGVLGKRFYLYFTNKETAYTRYTVSLLPTTHIHTYSKIPAGGRDGLPGGTRPPPTGPGGPLPNPPVLVVFTLDTGSYPGGEIDLSNLSALSGSKIAPEGGGGAGGREPEPGGGVFSFKVLPSYGGGGAGTLGAG